MKNIAAVASQSMSKKKLLLIQPMFFSPKLDRNNRTLMPLGLAYIAAYTPEHWDVTIIDEQVEKMRFEDADLVGLTTTTGNINRAYEIAAYYRKLGIPVVLGGVHVSMVPDEAEPYCDAIVIGDAEGVWEDVIKDVEQGQIKKRYQSFTTNIEGLKLPRTDLCKGKYLLGSISTSRGCPLRCTFCAIHNFYEQQYHLRPVEEVIEELKTIDYKVLFFTDGNLFGYNKKARDRFVELCRRMIEEKKKGTITFKHWVGYVTANMLDDEEALTLAAASGCKSILVGFESVNPSSLKEMKKASNIKRANRYDELIANAKRHGIMVTAEIVLGFDSDDEKTVKLTRKFIEESGIDVLRLQILQPIPGTETFDQLYKENRLYFYKAPDDWNILAEHFVLGINFELNQLDPYFLKKEVVDMGRSFYSLPKIIKRSIKAFFVYKNLPFVLYFIVLSIKSRRTYQNYEVSEKLVREEIETGRARLKARLGNRLPVVETIG